MDGCTLMDNDPILCEQNTSDIHVTYSILFYSLTLHTHMQIGPWTGFIYGVQISE